MVFYNKAVLTFMKIKLLDNSFVTITDDMDRDKIGNILSNIKDDVAEIEIVNELDIKYYVDNIFFGFRNLQQVIVNENVNKTPPFNFEKYQTPIVTLVIKGKTFRPYNIFNGEYPNLYQLVYVENDSLAMQYQNWLEENDFASQVRVIGNDG